MIEIYGDMPQLNNTYCYINDSVEYQSVGITEIDSGIKVSIMSWSGKFYKKAINLPLNKDTPLFMISDYIEDRLGENEISDVIKKILKEEENKCMR